MEEPAQPCPEPERLSDLGNAHPWSLGLIRAPRGQAAASTAQLWNTEALPKSGRRPGAAPHRHRSPHSTPGEGEEKGAQGRGEFTVTLHTAVPKAPDRSPRIPPAVGWGRIENHTQNEKHVCTATVNTEKKLNNGIHGILQEIKYLDVHPENEVPCSHCGALRKEIKQREDGELPRPGQAEPILSQWPCCQTSL